jgi:phage terminase large subunit GpA-like protein
MSLAPADLERIWHEAWRPDPELDVDEWADLNRVLTSKSAHVIGPWRTSLAPFAREWMKNVSPSSECQRMVVMSARQMAKTDGLGLNWIGYTMACAPGPMIAVQPTLEMGKLFRKQRVNPMIEACAALREVIPLSRSRDSGNTVLVLEYPGGIFRVGGANSSASLRSMPVRLIFGDEIDEWPDDVDGHGDPLAIVEQGAANFPNRKIALAGNPGIRGKSRTETQFMLGDQRRYVIPCPHCGRMDFLTWQGRDWFGSEDGLHHRIEWEKPVPPGETPVAYMVCSGCNQRVEEHYKTDMLARGEWVPMAVGDGRTRSYQISGLYSPLGFRTWSECATEFLNAKDNPSLLRAFVNNVLGETYEERSDRVEVHELQKEGRLEDYGLMPDGSPVEVPHGVGVLVSATDTQDDRLIHLVIGFGAGEESWLIEWRELEGDPRKGQVWLQLDQEISRQFRHASGQLMMVERAVVDSGGHATDDVYKYCAHRRERGVFAIFGDRSQQKPLVGMASRRNRYRAPVFPLCVDTGRADVISRLKMRDRGAGFVHLPKGIELEYLKQLTSTRAMWKYVTGKMTRVWSRTYHPRDHAFDLNVYALAALRMMGPALIQDLARRSAEYSKPAPGGERMDGGTAAPTPAPDPVAPKPTPFQERNAWVRAGLPPSRRR